MRTIPADVVHHIGSHLNLRDYRSMAKVLPRHCMVSECKSITASHQQLVHKGTSMVLLEPFDELSEWHLHVSRVMCVGRQMDDGFYFDARVIPMFRTHQNLSHLSLSQLEYSDWSMSFLTCCPWITHLSIRQCTFCRENGSSLKHIQDLTLDYEMGSLDWLALDCSILTNLKELTLIQANDLQIAHWAEMSHLVIRLFVPVETNTIGLLTSRLHFSCYSQSSCGLDVQDQVMQASSIQSDKNFSIHHLMSCPNAVQIQCSVQECDSDALIRHSPQLQRLELRYLTRSMAWMHLQGLETSLLRVCILHNASIMHLTNLPNLEVLHLEIPDNLVTPMTIMLPKLQQFHFHQTTRVVQPLSIKLNCPAITDVAIPVFLMPMIAAQCPQTSKLDVFVCNTREDVTLEHKIILPDLTRLRLYAHTQIQMMYLVHSFARCSYLSSLQLFLRDSPHHYQTNALLFARLIFFESCRWK